MREDRLHDLADAIRDEKELQKCFRHGSPIFFDEKECPACRLERENFSRKRPADVWYPAGSPPARLEN